MNSTTETNHQPNPALIFENLNAYQRSSALKAAVELDLFTQIGRGHHQVEPLARAVQASPRGVRILCDYLVLSGFLLKDKDQYALTVDSRLFLDSSSPACFSSIVRFLLDPHITSPFEDLASIVRSGTTSLPDQGTVTPDNPIWVSFARHMAPMIRPAAEEIAGLVAGDGDLRVLDIAAGHGLFGIAIAQRNPKAQITALDWPNVLAVARENAESTGVANRQSHLPGDAFETDFGGPYDLVLVTNFYHHFDQPTCETLMRKIHAALTPGGRCVTLDFVPNDDRVSPPAEAAFAMMMLGTTPAGDAYTFSEYETMFRNAGYASSELRHLQRAPESLVVSTKAN
ncbi:MAG: methyltransferase [Acidobacteriaceae bacterium]